MRECRGGGAGVSSWGGGLEYKWEVYWHQLGSGCTALRAALSTHTLRRARGASEKGGAISAGAVRPSLHFEAPGSPFVGVGEFPRFLSQILRTARIRKSARI